MTKVLVGLLVPVTDRENGVQQHVAGLTPSTQAALSIAREQLVGQQTHCCSRVLGCIAELDPVTEALFSTKPNFKTLGCRQGRVSLPSPGLHTLPVSSHPGTAGPNQQTMQQPRRQGP